MKQYRILLVDDEILLLESLEIILSLNDMQIVGKAHDGREALELLEQVSCDLALVDLNMKGMGGIELITHLKRLYPELKILVLTTFYDDHYITEAVANGADGYLLKDSGKEAILGAIGQIMEGRNVIDNKVMQRLAVLMSGKQEPSTVTEPEGMTKRESEILSLMVQGYTNQQIAKELYISEGTVKNYISGIYDKTGIHDRAKLIVAMKM
ncbi:MAG: response regulator transcription factor [Lachnospiraceae bacterium]|nr:response regulator transcription factor [Lachnospiraceae bacterium]